MADLHFDEAAERAHGALRDLAGGGYFQKAVLNIDVLGQQRLLVWSTEAGPIGDATVAELCASLARAGGAWWTGEVWRAGLSKADDGFYESMWEQATPISGEPRVRIDERHRSRSAWFVEPVSPKRCEEEDEEARRPKVVVFYSFKGGVGRTTALAALAIQRARTGERVVVVDHDLDAPGAGRLFAADEQGTTSAWGVVDYWLEQAVGRALPLADYHHSCRRRRVVGAGEAIVFPAGRLGPEAGYLEKLARLDLEPRASGSGPLGALLSAIREELSPSLILIDARAGLADSAGWLLSGFADLHVLVSTGSEQGWQGTRLVIDRLGRQRVLRDLPQAGLLLVHTMIPEISGANAGLRQAFEDRALEELRDLYYEKDVTRPPEERHGPPAGEDPFWRLAESENSDAPHVPVGLSYKTRLATYDDLEQVADVLASDPEFVALGERIMERLGLARPGEQP